MKITETIELLKVDPDSTLVLLGKKELEKILDHLAKKYYNETPIVSDELFDVIKEYYENEYNTKYKVGAPVKSIKSTKSTKSTKSSKLNKANEKVILPYWMGSLDKIKPSSNAFNNWINKFPGPYVLSWKLDGISALLYKSQGNVYMYTRGDGVEGQDISHCIEMIGLNGININKMVEGDAIRGELIMSKKNFKTISDRMANPRNAVSGIIGTKKPDPELVKLIDFVAYWVLSPQLKASDQLEYIKKKGFVPRSVEYEIKKTITLEELSSKLIEGRNSHVYEIDGIVVMDDSKYYPIETGSNPTYAFAFKQLLTDQIAEATVLDVLWEVSKDKYIKPKIKINTIELGGVEITYATAFNAKFVVDNCIGPGAQIQIVRSGDVIPKIEKVLKPAESAKPKLPTIKYEWNETGVDIIASDLDADTMEKIIVKKLTYFFDTLNIKWMGETTIEKFVSNGYDDLWKILQANKKQIENIEGLGKTLVEKLYSSIETGLEGRKLEEIMAASQVFGRGIGIKKFKLIINDYPNILEIFKEKGSSHTKELINNIMGFDTKTTNKIVDSMGEFVEYLNKFLKLKPNLLKSEKNIKSTKSTKSTESTKSNKTINSKLKLNKYAGKKIVFTGFRDKEIEEELENAGAKISGSVSSNTNLVIASNLDEKSSKIIKAKELNIETISKEEFYKSIGH